MKVRYISSPKQDSLLAPSEYRRYINHILGFNIFFNLVIFSLLTYLIVSKLWGFNYFHSLNLYLKFDKSIDRAVFKLITLTFILISAYTSYVITEYLTKAVKKQIVKSGNIIDDTNDVLINLDNKFNSKEKDLAFIEKGQMDFNSIKPKKMTYTIYYPKQILELSQVVIGEAGSGKTIYTDGKIKQVIDNGHKLIIHNVKGDELEKLDGYVPLYLIEPWNKKSGYAIDFLNLIASKEIQNENSRIRTFVLAFTESISKTDFFQIGSISVIESFVRFVVRTTKINNEVKGTLGDIVEKWNSFNIQSVDISLLENQDTDIKTLEKELDKNKEQLDLINKFISIYNPTASIYINSQNAKTSLCVLASCIDIIRKFETLSSFWGSKEKSKSLNIRKWIANKKDRQVIVLSNSNTYGDIANCYISAFINLLVPELIDNSYKPVAQIHFILDEFPQLNSIDLNTFLKLPDVGRSKNIRTTVIIQRSSQIKEKFTSNNKPADSKSFMASFQNKVICRFASDDLDYVKDVLGEQTLIEYSTTGNNSAQGQTFSNKTTEITKPAYNPTDLNNQLGPQFLNDKFIGVKVLFKFPQFDTLPLVILPPVSFPKKFKSQYISNATTNINKKLSKSNEDKEEDKEIVSEKVEVIESIETTNINPLELDTEIKEPIADALQEQLLHSIDPNLSTVNMITDLLDSLDTQNLNNNTTEIESTKTVSKTKTIKKELEI